MAVARLLIVDDEEDILTSLESFLTGALGVEVVKADSGAAGLTALSKTSFDLVISDFRMPVMDGLHFLRRAAEMRPEVPRILLTAFPDMHLAIQAINQARIARFLTKPVDPDQLANIVKDLLSETRRKRLGHEALQRSSHLDAAEPDGRGRPRRAA
jgi:DNA-binding NtrC family response regulator